MALSASCKVGSAVKVSLRAEARQQARSNGSLPVLQRRSILIGYGRNATCQLLLAPSSKSVRQRMVRNVQAVQTAVENGKAPHTKSFQGVTTEQGRLCSSL